MTILPTFHCMLFMRVTCWHDHGKAECPALLFFWICPAAIVWTSPCRQEITLQLWRPQARQTSPCLGLVTNKIRSKEKLSASICPAVVTSQAPWRWCSAELLFSREGFGGAWQKPLKVSHKDVAGSIPFGLTLVQLQQCTSGAVQWPPAKNWELEVAGEG